MPTQRWLPAVCVFLVLAVGAPTLPVAAQESGPGSAAAQISAKPLTLEQAIANALTLNPQVRQAQEDLNAALAGVTQARAARSVTANVAVTHTTISEVPEFTIPMPGPSGEVVLQTFSLGSKQQTQGALTVAKPLYTGGKISALVRQSRAGASASAEGLVRTRQTLANEVKQAYYGVLVAAEFVHVAQDALASAREHLRVAQAHFGAGAAPRFDVLRAETRVAESEQSLIQARNGLNLVRAALNNAMGVAQDEQFELTTPFAQPPAELGDLSGLIAQAHASRPEMRQVQAQVAAAGAAADVARADRHPTLGLAWVATRVLDATAFQINNWTLALTAGWTIFNGKQTSAAVSRARHQRESARGLLEQLRQGVELQVRQAYLDLNSANERIIAAAKGVTQAQEALRIANVRYEAGVGISVEVIDAEVALAAARSQHVQAVYDYSVALARLEYAIGAWQPPAETRTP